MGHNEKLVSSQAVVIRDSTGKVFSAGDIGMIIMSGPIAYVNTGVAWRPLNT